MRFGYFFTVGPMVSRGVARLRFPFSKSINDELKPIPGCRYAPELGRGVWVGPREMAHFYKDLAERHKLEYREEDLAPYSEQTRELRYADGMMPHQKEAIRKALAQRSLLFAIEMRGGKTAASIVTVREDGIEDGILVVCPASVRRTWLREIDKWWVGHPSVCLIEPGKDPEPAAITVSSFELLHKVSTEGWRAIIVDEAHHIGNYDSRQGRGSRKTRGTVRGERVIELAARNPDSMRLALTGTPIRTEVKGLWAVLEFLAPSSYQNKFAFCHRYAGKVFNSNRRGNYPYDWQGIDQEHIAELQQRLDWVSVRATKADFMAHLPSVATEVVLLDADVKMDPRKAIREFAAGRAKMDDVVRAHSAAKVRHAIDHVVQAAENGRVVVLSYFHSTAQALRTELTKRRKDLLVDVITGKIPTKQRDERIQTLAKADNSVMIATLRSVEEGIDLSAFSQVFYSEIYPSPGVMEQSTSRYQNMASSEPVTIKFLVIAGSAEERMAEKLKKRLDDNAGVYKASASSTNMSGALAGDEMNDDDFKAYLRDLSMQIIEEEEG